MSSWRWVSASQRGTAHEARKEGRQDAYRVLTAGGFIVAVACDGAGSACYGGAGAALTARMISEFARNSIVSSGRQPRLGEILGWLTAVINKIAKAAERRNCEPTAFASTLVLAISNGATTQTVHIGDGAIVTRPIGSDDYRVQSWPHNGEYASETFFITDSCVHVHTSISEVPIDRMAVMTDGIERLALDFREHCAHFGFFTRMFAPLAPPGPTERHGREFVLSSKLRAFLDSPPVNERTDDDKTLILAALS
jgi:hypothetical protein